MAFSVVGAAVVACIFRTTCGDTLTRYGCHSPTIAMHSYLVSRSAVSCVVSFVPSLACGSHVARALAHSTHVNIGDVVVRADSACLRSPTQSPRLRPFAVGSLTVVGTGERAPLRFNTHTAVYSMYMQIFEKSGSWVLTQ